MISIISSQMKKQTKHQQRRRSNFPYARCYWIHCKLFLLRQFCFVACDLGKYCFITEEIGIYLVFQAIVSRSSLPPHFILYYLLLHLGHNKKDNVEIHKDLAI